ITRTSVCASSPRVFVPPLGILWLRRRGRGAELRREATGRLRRRRHCVEVPVGIVVVIRETSTRWPAIHSTARIISTRDGRREHRGALRRGGIARRAFVAGVTNSCSPHPAVSSHPSHPSLPPSPPPSPTLLITHAPNHQRHNHPPHHPRPSSHSDNNASRNPTCSFALKDANSPRAILACAGRAPKRWTLGSVCERSGTTRAQPNLRPQARRLPAHRK
ncbi:hypothetical protein B0H16DRAFT_1585479, partial [Mycena metata]